MLHLLSSAMRNLLLFELLVISLCSTVSRCHGRRVFRQISRFWSSSGSGSSGRNRNHRQIFKVRGGESSFSRPPDYEHGQRYEGEDLPPDLPNYGDDDESRKQLMQQQQGQEQYPYNPQQQQQQHPGGGPGTDFRYSQQSHGSNSQYHSDQEGPYHQQQQQSPPQLPPDGSYGTETDNGQPPGYQQQQSPLLPDVSSLFAEEDETENLSMDSAFGGNSFGDKPSDGSRTDLSSFDKQYILKGLARLYRKKILPLEISSRYGHFHSPPLSPADFVAPPQVLLLGQYSVGKTSFIKYLVGRDFPGIRVGPEPTTDRFTAIMWGPNDTIIPGAAFCSQTDRPFTGLSPYGNNFLSRLEGVETDSPILRNVTLIDTPGILSGQKQRSRNYDYESVMKWFGERADLVIVMFDAHKLDISDELKQVMELFIPHLDKIRIVLNKADSVTTQQLMRVYGALMWSLGKVMNTPEVSRVYMGSFWDAPLQNTEQMDLLQQEETDLLNDIMNLPQQAALRRINELVKRARSVKVHAYIIHYLRKQLPYTWGKREKQRRLIGRLESEFAAAARRYSLPKGDFPSLEPFRKALLEIKDISEFPKLDKKLVREMDKVFSVDIPDLLEKARNQR